MASGITSRSGEGFVATDEEVLVDGRVMEGGGQILRNCVSLVRNHAWCARGRNASVTLVFGGTAVVTYTGVFT